MCDILENISRATGVVYSDEQLNILNSEGGLCILACAGSGKTTILTHLIAKRIYSGEIKDPSRLLCTTYSKGGADELEDRANRLLQRLGMNVPIKVCTMHALYLEILKYFGFPTNVISNKDRAKFIKEACKDVDIVLGEEDFRTLDSLLSYQVNNLLSDIQLVQSYAYTLEEIPLDKYSMIRKGYSSRKAKAKLIDFDDMQFYIYFLMYNQKREDIVEYCHNKWADIYVDEAQDMSKIQYMILKKLVKDANKLVIIGDDDQCIYQWRGADPSIILNACADYPIKRCVLSTNYRCAGRIVEKASVGIKFNTIRSDKSMIPYKDGGEIKICDCGDVDIYKMSKYAFEHIRGLVESGVKPDNIAILSRNNNHLCILSNMLFRYGIHCTSSQEMKMTQSFIYKSIKNAIKMARNNYDHKLTADVLSMLCLYMKKIEAMRISKIQDNGGMSFKNILDYVGMLLGQKCKQDISSIKIPKLVEEQLNIWVNQLRFESKDSLIRLMELYSDNISEEDRAKGILVMYMEATDFMYRNNDDRRRYVVGLIEYFKDLIEEYGYDKFMSYLSTSERYEEGRMVVPGRKVCMSTIHGAKGKEWDHVVLFADDNIAFPSFQNIAKQLNKIDIKDIKYGIDEDRRLHYVAITRAKKELAIFTHREHVSVYLLEAFGLFDYGSNNDAEIIERARCNNLRSEEILAIDNELLSDKYRYNIKLEAKDGKE